MSMNSLERLSFIDILKIISTFAIVLLHVSAIYVRMDAQLLNPSGALPYIINALARTALPLFMMISGVLLLRDRYQFNLKKKFSFILKNYVLWSALYVVVDQAMRLYNGDVLLSPAEMVVSWVRGPYHFWYLQMLLGFYLLMPLLARLKGLQTLSYATLLLFIIIYIYNPLAPHLPVCVQTFADQVILMNPSTMLFFLLLGAWLYRVPHRPKLALAAAVAVLAGVGIRLYQLFSTPTYQASSALQPLNTYSELLLAAGIFLSDRLSLPPLQIRCQDPISFSMHAAHLHRFCAGHFCVSGLCSADMGCSHSLANIDHSALVRRGLSCFLADCPCADT